MIRKILFYVLVYVSGAINLALHKPAWQSTTQWGGDPGRAVDGNNDTHYGQDMSGSCSRTVENKVPWWVVDLHSEYRITAVQITNIKSATSRRYDAIHID